MRAQESQAELFRWSYFSECMALALKKFRFSSLFICEPSGEEVADLFQSILGSALPRVLQPEENQMRSHVRRLCVCVSEDVTSAGVRSSLLRRILGRASRDKGEVVR